MSCPDPVARVAAHILDCALAQIEAVCALPPPGRVFLAPGLDVPHDDCCEGGGQLWVRVIDQVPYRPSTRTLDRCGSGMKTVRFGVGTVRCVHSLDARGNPPSAGTASDDAIELWQDANAVEQAFYCCLSLDADLLGKSLDRYDPIGPLGGCAGGEWTISARVRSCGCG